MFEPSSIVPDDEHERTCGHCETRKSVDEFYSDGKGPGGVKKYRRDCKECYRITRLKSRKKPVKATVPVKRGKRR